MPGPVLVPLVAQCTGAGPCSLPTGLPWYFGLAVALVWLAAVVGVIVLARRRLALHLRRRRTRGGDRRALDAATPGADVERW